MNQQLEKIKRIFKETGAIVTDSHFIYASGRHGNIYVDKDSICADPEAISVLCEFIAQRFADKGVEVVLAPAIGAIAISQWTAFHLSKLTGRKVLATYAEKETASIADPDALGRKCFAETGNFIVGRSHTERVRGNNVLVVEDILTTGGSALKVVEAASRLDATVVGLAVLCNRGGVRKEDVGDPPELFALLNLSLETWSSDKCPLCAADMPINTSLGKGKQLVHK